MISPNWKEYCTIYIGFPKHFVATDYDIKHLFLYCSALGDQQANNKTFNGLKILELLDGSKNKNDSADASTTSVPGTDSIYR